MILRRSQRKPGLANAGVTAQQHHDRGFAGRFTQGELQLREFPGAPDEVT